jgi:hypothetical protein
MIPEHLGVGDGIRHLQSDGVLNPDGLTELARFGSRLGDHLRAVIVASADADVPELPGFALYQDAGGSSALRMGFSDPVGRLYRRAAAAREQNLTSYLQQVFSWLRDAGAGHRRIP